VIASRRPRTASILVLIAGACTSSGPSITLEVPITTTSATDPAATDRPVEVAPTLVIDVAAAGDDISPLILGISGNSDAQYVLDAGITLGSWGGETATRYNYVIGNASNGGRDANYQNLPIGLPGNAAAAFVASASGSGIESRVAVPTLGWIASNAEPTTCSFPLTDGGCAIADGASCLEPGIAADPLDTSVTSTARAVASWVADLVSDPLTTPRFIAFDNEPELWGVNHYDVHPACSTYEEILLKYLEYASAVRDVAPDAEMMGPVICCWFDYWRTAPGPADGSGEDFVSWFLRNVHQYDQANGGRALDVVDVRYFPQADVVNDRVDAETAARRLRSTRSLYDPVYTDESWVSTRIRFIPRLRAIVEAAYPGTPIGISEWNWGADGTLNGALAIADVLGIYGREGVYLASYWEQPAAGSPGYFAFKMHGNYDGRGGRFGGQSVPVVAEGADAFEDLGAYAAYAASENVLRLMLINKNPDTAIDLALDIRSLETARTGRVFRYGPDDLDAITEEVLPLGDHPSIVLPPYSITLVEVPATS
jgi:hypothetical protein